MNTIFNCPHSFCIGGTGKVYEGRGWDVVGTHTPKYNSNSTGICFIGDFRSKSVRVHVPVLITKQIATKQRELGT